MEGVSFGTLLHHSPILVRKQNLGIATWIKCSILGGVFGQKTERGCCFKSVTSNSTPYLMSHSPSYFLIHPILAS